MPGNVGAAFNYYQPLPPGGGKLAVVAANQELSCSHVGVPIDQAVLAGVKAMAKRAIAAAPTGSRFFALLIRGLTFGVDSLSPMEPIHVELEALGVACEIASEGTLAHENQDANLGLLVGHARAGYQIMIIGHSMGGDEVWAICQALASMIIILLIRLLPTHTSCRTHAIYPVVSHKVPCHIEDIGRMVDRAHCGEPVAKFATRDEAIEAGRKAPNRKSRSDRNAIVSAIPDPWA